jgi:hypothetical protein
MMILLAFFLGLLAGVITKGIHIHHHQVQEMKQSEAVKFNESLVNYLPNDVRQYYEENNGQNRF